MLKRRKKERVREEPRPKFVPFGELRRAIKLRREKIRIKKAKPRIIKWKKRVEPSPGVTLLGKAENKK